MAGIYGSSGGSVARAVTSGLREYSNRVDNRERVQAESAEFRLRKNQANAANDPDSIRERQEALDAQSRALTAKVSKQEAFEAFRMYMHTSNPKHLTELVKKNPQVANAMGGYTSIQPLDYAMDHNLLTAQGLTADQFSSFRHLKGIQPDGSEELVDIQHLFAGSGFLNTITNEQLDTLIKKKKLFETDGDSSTKPGGFEKEARFIAETTDQDIADVTSALYQEKLAGNLPGKIEYGREQTQRLFEVFGGEENYFNTDFQDTKNRTMASSYIAAIERAYDAKLSAADRADIKDLNSLITMAQLTEDTLTPEVSGTLDTVLRTAKEYVSNSVKEVDNVQAQSAYAAFRNTVRHALFGSALTDGEIKAFNEAFGNLRQKYPAVVTQFKTALEQTKSKLQTVYDLNDPVLAKYYLGKSTEDIATIIRSIDERIELIRQAETRGEVPLVGDTAEIIEQGEQPADTNTGPDFSKAFGPAPGS